VPLKSDDTSARKRTTQATTPESKTTALTDDAEGLKRLREALKLISFHNPGVHFKADRKDFHMDALSSAIALKVDWDLQLTLMASSLYRLLAAQIANGYETAKSRHIFRDFIDATAQISISHDEVLVKFQRRAHNPFLLEAGFGDLETRIPW